MDAMKIDTGALATQRPETPISVIERYYDLIVSSSSDFEINTSGAAFEPSMRLPELDPRMQSFLSVATAQFFEMGSYRDVPLRLFDLRQNESTQTTKTFASTLIVARAIRHIQETGDSILLFSPSSGNKAIALRDAVLRALKAKLVHPEQLRIVTLTPMQTIGKLRKTELYDDPRLRDLNPIFVLDTESPEAVKIVGQQFKELFNRQPVGDSKLWHSLRLENYRFSDQARAFFDFEYGDAWDTDRKTVHVHAVSSAYGLLGYCSGVELASLAVVQRCKQSGDIVGLSRIHQKVDVSAGWKYVLGEMSHRESKRRIQSIKQGFKFDTSVEDEDFFSFYRSMHVPTMSARYGAFARSVQEQSAYRDLFKPGVLFRVHLNEEWVAGSVSHIDGAARTLNARLIGVKGGGALYRENGAQNFVYHAILEWASNQSSIDSVDFQGCEPFLSKGTFQYKKRFGAQAIIPPNTFGRMRILIRAPTLSAAARQFLINNPCIGLNADGELQAQYFFDSDHEIRSDIPFAAKGIHSRVSHNLDQWHD